MAEPLLHKDLKYSKSAFFCESFTLPFANSATNQALLEPCNEAPPISPRKANADLSTDCARSAHLGVFFQFRNPPSTTDCARFAHPDAFFEVPNPPSTTDCASFAHPDAVFVVASAQSRAYFTGFALPHVDPNAQARAGCAGFAHEACGNDGDCTCVQVGSADVCDAKGGVSCRETSRGNIAKTHGGIRDTCGVLSYPCVEVAECSLPCLSSDPQPCVSECSSATSMVTDTVSESMSRSKDSDTSRSKDANMDTNFTETHWTNAKHRSYLTLMEANFVKVLYRREYCALDVCGQAPCRPGSSSPPLPSSLRKFKSGQSGDWWMPEPHFPACIPSALLKSPWVNNFGRHNSVNACHQIKDENTWTSVNMDEGDEEVDSPLTFISHAAEPQKVNEMIRRHRRAPRSKMGLQEKHMSKKDVLQELTVHSTSFPNLKKRGFQPDFDQNPYTRHKREKS